LSAGVALACAAASGDRAAINNPSAHRRATRRLFDDGDIWLDSKRKLWVEASIAPTTFGKKAVNEGHFLARIEGVQAGVLNVTAAKARSFMTNWRPPDPGPSAAALADQVEALIDRHGLSRGRVAMYLFSARNGLPRFRLVKVPTGRTLARVLAFIADPPIDDFKGRVRGRQVRRTPAGDPTVGAARQAAALRRSQTAQAERILDRNPDAVSGRNSGITTAIASVRRHRAEEARRGDPIEHAKLALRKRGRVVFDASVDGGRKGRFFVSGQVDPDSGKRRQLTIEELTALAWKVNPTAMRELSGRAEQ